MPTYVMQEIKCKEKHMKINSHRSDLHKNWDLRVGNNRDEKCVIIPIVKWEQYAFSV